MTKDELIQRVSELESFIKLQEMEMDRLVDERVDERMSKIKDDTTRRTYMGESLGEHAVREVNAMLQQNLPTMINDAIPEDLKEQLHGIDNITSRANIRVSTYIDPINYSEIVTYNVYIPPTTIEVCTTLPTSY